MICGRCKATVEDGSIFCNQCGKKLTATKKRRTKSRGNGTGCAYYDSVHRYWVAQVIVDYKFPDDKMKALIPVKKTKGGFKRKEDALAYCPTLKGTKTVEDPTLQQIYDQWETWYSPRVDSSTLAGYRAAYAYYKPLHSMKMTEISAGDLQKCMDECPRGKRTHQNMKVIAGLLWKYAKSKHIVSQIESETLFTGKGRSVKREALNDFEVEKIRAAIGQERYAEYIYCICYLGFRPGEMLELTKAQLVEHDGRLFLIGGKKTEAGRDRTVPVHHKIEIIIRQRMLIPGTDMIFPQYVFDRKGQFCEFKQMTDNYFREFVFKKVCHKLEIADGKVPYSARHTFSNKLKTADGDNIDKAALMGHSDYTFTQTNYQSTNFEELTAVMDSIK